MFKRNKWGNTDGNKEAGDCYMKEIIDKPINRVLSFFLKSTQQLKISTRHVFTLNNRTGDKKNPIVETSSLWY